MHKISAEHISAALNHAVLAEEHGKFLERYAQELHERAVSTRERELAKAIAEHGRTVQVYAQKAQKYARAAEREKSTENYGKSACLHSKASQAYIQAVGLCLAVQSERLRQLKETLIKAKTDSNGGHDGGRILSRENSPAIVYFNSRQLTVYQRGVTRSLSGLSAELV